MQLHFDSDRGMDASLSMPPRRILPLGQHIRCKPVIVAFQTHHSHSAHQGEWTLTKGVRIILRHTTYLLLGLSHCRSLQLNTADLSPSFVGIFMDQRMVWRGPSEQTKAQFLGVHIPSKNVERPGHSSERLHLNEREKQTYLQPSFIRHAHPPRERIDDDWSNVLWSNVLCPTCYMLGLVPFFLVQPYCSIELCPTQQLYITQQSRTCTRTRLFPSKEPVPWNSFPKDVLGS